MIRAWMVGFKGNLGIIVAAVNEAEAIENAQQELKDSRLPLIPVIGIRREPEVERVAHELVRELIERVEFDAFGRRPE